MITAWITIRATEAETRGVVAYREVALSRGVGIEVEVRLQRERDGRDSILRAVPKGRSYRGQNKRKKNEIKRTDFRFSQKTAG